MIWDYQTILDGISHGNIYEVFINGLAIRAPMSLIIQNRANQIKMVAQYTPYNMFSLTMVNGKISLCGSDDSCSYTITMDTRSARTTEINSEITKKQHFEVDHTYEC